MRVMDKKQEVTLEKEERRQRTQPVRVLANMISDIADVSIEQIAKSKSQLPEICDGEKVIGHLGPKDLSFKQMFAYIDEMEGFSQRAATAGDCEPDDFCMNIAWRNNDNYISILQIVMHRALAFRFKKDIRLKLALRRGWTVVIIR